MTQSFRKNPLAEYLVPKFGRAYESDFWTPGLRDAVQRWLTRDATDGLFVAILSELEDFPIEGHTVEAQARFIVKMYEPWAIVDAAYNAAAKTAPNLESLLDAYGEVIDYDEVKYWLFKNATREQLVELARTFAPDHSPASAVLLDKAVPRWDSLELSHVEPKELLAAWRAVIAPDGVTARKVPRTGQFIKTIRDWAREHGYQVGERGRLSVEIVKAYDAAQVRQSIKET